MRGANVPSAAAELLGLGMDCRKRQQSTVPLTTCSTQCAHPDCMGSALIQWGERAVNTGKPEG